MLTAYDYTPHPKHTEDNLAKLTVYNELPRIVSFRGKTLVLHPGSNVVDKDLFTSLFSGGSKAKKDPTMAWYYEQGALDVVEEDGSDWSAPDVKRAKKVSKELLGPSHRTASSMRRAKRSDVNDTTEIQEAEVVEPVAPTRQGGGVPGNVEEAKALIAETDDPELLNKWMAHESRATIVPLLMERLDEVDG